MQEVRFPFYARVALVLLAFVLVIFILVEGKGIFVPLFFSLLIAFLLYPFSKWIERKTGLKKHLAALISLSSFIALAVALVYFITFEILEFSQDIPILQKNITGFIDNTQDWIIKEYHINSSEQLGYLHQVMNGIFNYVTNSFAAIFIGVTEFIVWTVLVFVYTYFIMCYRKLLFNFMMSVFSKVNRGDVKSVIMETRNIINSYLQGLLIEFSILAIVISCGLFLLGVKYALLLGVIAALLNIIPYLGFLIGAILTVMISLMYGSPFLAMEAFIMLLIIHVSDANILLPKVIGSKMKMNSLTTIIAVISGGVIWGIAGMFLAIPVCAVLKIVFDRTEVLKPWGMLMGVEDKNLENQKEKM